MATLLREGPKFLIDISKHEYTTGKEAFELDSYRVYVYTPEMMVCRSSGPFASRCRYAAVIKPGGSSRQFEGEGFSTSTCS